jgi:hypothetical protein
LELPFLTGPQAAIAPPPFWKLTTINTNLTEKARLPTGRPVDQLERASSLVMGLFNKRLDLLPSHPKAVHTDWKGLRQNRSSSPTGLALPFLPESSLL